MTRSARTAWLGLLIALVLVPATADTTVQKIVPASRGAFMRFGASCAVDGDVLAVGDAPFGVTSVTVFELSDGAWTERQRIGSSSGVGAAGPAVAVRGDTIFVGGTADGTDGPAGPAVHEFVRDGTTWVRQATIRPSDPATVESFTGALDVDGDTLVVGDSMNDAGATDTGAVYVFVRDGAAWTQQAKLVASDANVDDRFGCDVAVSGDTILVGALGDDEIANASGAAYVFVRSGTTWTEQQKLIPSTVNTYDQAGTCVALDGDTAVVGSPFDDDQGRSSGNVFVFTRWGTAWGQSYVLPTYEAHDLSFFGSALEIEGDRILVGAPGHDANGSYAGRAYLFRWDPPLGRWVTAESFDSPEAAAQDQFGSSVAMDGLTVVVGASTDADLGEATGSAWVLELEPPVVETTAALVPTEVVVVLPATKAADPKGRAPGLYAKGILETGSNPVDLSRSGSLSVGTRSWWVSGFTPSRDGRKFTYESPGMLFVVTAPATGCSETTFSLAIEDDFRGIVDPEGPVTIRWATDGVWAESTVDLAGGKFRLTASPETLDPDTMLCVGTTARRLGAGRDSFTTTLRWGGTGEVPATAPDVAFTLGSEFEATLDPAKFTLKKGVWRYSDPQAAGIWRATIDFAKCRAVFQARKCSIGDFDQGPVPLSFYLRIGEMKRSLYVRATMRKKTLRY